MKEKNIYEVKDIFSMSTNMYTRVHGKKRYSARNQKYLVVSGDSNLTYLWYDNNTYTWYDSYLIINDTLIALV